MILTCPACGTQYVVKDGAIPEGGRKVRCASCRHSWHQDSAPLELTEAAPVEMAPGDGELEQGRESGPRAEEWPPGADEAVDAAEPAEELPHTVDSAVEDNDGQDSDIADSGEAAAASDTPDATERYDEDAGERATTSPAGVELATGPMTVDITEQDDDFSPFAARRPAERPQRGPLIAILAIIILVTAAAAAFWFLAPADLKARIGLAEARQTPLQLMMTHSDRQALASGNELLAVSGRVINPTSKAQPVPPIQAELRSKTGTIVYRWTIAPPTATLAPGQSARFNSAEVNVPSGGEELTVSLGAPGA